MSTQDQAPFGSDGLVIGLATHLGAHSLIARLQDEILAMDFQVSIAMLRGRSAAMLHGQSVPDVMLT